MIGLGTVRKYLKFFSFSLREKGGRGSRTPGNTKPEEKLEENRGGGGWVGEINLRKTSFLKNLRYFCIAPGLRWLFPTLGGINIF